MPFEQVLKLSRNNLSKLLEKSKNIKNKKYFHLLLDCNGDIVWMDNKSLAEFEINKQFARRNIIDLMVPFS